MFGKKPGSTYVQIEHIKDCVPAMDLKAGDYCHLLDERGNKIEETVYLIATLTQSFYALKAHTLEEETEDVSSDAQMLLVDIQTGITRPVKSLDWVFLIPRVDFMLKV